MPLIVIEVLLLFQITFIWAFYSKFDRLFYIKKLQTVKLSHCWITLINKVSHTKKYDSLHKILNKTNGQTWSQKSQTNYIMKRMDTRPLSINNSNDRAILIIEKSAKETTKLIPVNCVIRIKWVSHGMFWWHGTILKKERRKLSNPNKMCSIFWSTMIDTNTQKLIRWGYNAFW